MCVLRTFNDDIFDAPLLALLLFPLALLLLEELGQYQGTHALNDLGKDGVAWIEQPGLCQCGVVQVDVALEHRVFCYSEVSANRRHGMLENV